MKYPSVFFAILLAWAAIIAIALWINQRTLTFELYVLAIVFTLVMFTIGFWRNK